MGSCKALLGSMHDDEPFEPLTPEVEACLQVAPGQNHAYGQKKQKPSILRLHGIGQSAGIFKDQLDMHFWLDIIGYDAEIVFVDAPHPVNELTWADPGIREIWDPMYYHQDVRMHRTWMFQIKQSRCKKTCSKNVEHLKNTIAKKV